jgi:hypothetical protein
MPGRRSGGLRRSGHGTWARGSGGEITGIVSLSIA